MHFPHRADRAVAIHSTVWRCPSPERPWLPICVATPVSFATRATRRASRMLCVSGFSQYTCLPAFIARIETYACRWSGVAMRTASIAFSFSSMTRKSSYAAQV